MSSELRLSSTASLVSERTSTGKSQANPSKISSAITRIKSFMFGKPRHEEVGLLRDCRLSDSTSSEPGGSSGTVSPASSQSSGAVSPETSQSSDALSVTSAGQTSSEAPSFPERLTSDPESLFKFSQRYQENLCAEYETRGVLIRHLLVPYRK